MRAQPTPPPGPCARRPIVPADVARCCQSIRLALMKKARQRVWRFSCGRGRA
jgi:hypothetical protein